MEKTQVLIVEDDGIIAMDLESRMKQLGHGVTSVVAYGEKVIEKIKENEPDVVLMDIILKGEIDGIEAAEEIRTQYDIPVIFITGYADKERLKRAKLAYPFGFILKPFSDKDLEVTIEMALYVAKVDAERKQAEDALRLERNNLRNIFESIEDGIYIVNQQYDTQYVNQVLVKDFGPYEGIKCYKYFHDRDEICTWCKNQDVFAGKTIRWEWYSLKNERTYDLIDTPMTLPDGTIGKLEIFRDITERRQTEEALRQAHDELEQRVEERTAELVKANEQLKKEIDEHKRTEKDLRLSEKRCRTVVEDQTEVICRFHVDGTFIFVNDVYCRFFGKSSQELFGKKWQPKAVSEDVAMIEKKLETLSEDNPIVTIENRVYSGSGEIRWMQFVNRGFFDNEGKLIEIQAVGRDINERKLAEEKLAEHRNHLEEIIKERDAKLEDANLKLQGEISERKQAE